MKVFVWPRKIVSQFEPGNLNIASHEIAGHVLVTDPQNVETLTETSYAFLTFHQKITSQFEISAFASESMSNSNLNGYFL